MNSQKAMLIIMDGWGIGQVPSSDAIRAANTPFTDSLYQKYPHTTLVTCGEAVGLPDGQMGNSEVGHLNLGAGRIVYQELQRINVAIRDGAFQQNKTLQAALEFARTQKKALHLIGLVSDGGVHSHLNHVKALIDCCTEKKLAQVYIHAFTDGRDCDPKSGLSFIKDLDQYLEGRTGKIASISGRYYAMDRDNRWERIKLAYDALVNGKGQTTTNAVQAIEESYHSNITDEFIQPTVVVNENGAPLATIQNGDVVICFNFRTDRCREITQALSQKDFPEQGMHKLSLHYTTMTEYDKTFENVNVLFETDNLPNTIGQVLEDAGRTQIRIAETEKYPHVSFFFSGGREKPFTGKKEL